MNIRIPILTLMLFLAFGGLSAQEEIVSKIEFEGLKRTKEHFLRRLIKTKENQPYDEAKVTLDVERLKRLAGIAKATVKESSDGNTIALTFEVVENFTIIPGPRISTAVDGSFAFQLSLFEFNFLGNGQLIGASFQRNVFDSFSVFWEHPFLFSDKVGFGVNYQDITRLEPIFFEQGEEDYRFNARRIEGKFLFNFDFNNEAELGLVFVDENYVLQDDNALAIRPTELNADKIFYRGNYNYVDLDIDYQYFDGFRSEFTGQYIQFRNGDAAGEEFLNNFLSLENDFSYYKRVGSKGNWANRLRLAAALGNEDSPFAPFTLDNQLNIRGVGNVVDRGTAAVVFNTEYRYTLYEKDWFVLQSNAFIDAGSWRNPGEDFSQLFDGSTVRVYPGVGFRLIHKRIFNAVFRLDYGYGIGPDATSGIVFGIGQYF